MDEHLFRNLLQVGMVVSDLDETLEKFQSLLGIGPLDVYKRQVYSLNEGSRPSTARRKRWKAGSMPSG